jgi:hypothetical protein
MRKCSLTGIVVLGAVAIFSPLALAQTAQPAQNDHSEAAKPAAKAKPFDPHDLAGIWDAAPYRQPKEEVRVGIGSQASKKDPPLTPAGEAKFKDNAKFEESGAVVDCDPWGPSRSLFSPRAFQIFPSQVALIQHFEYQDGWRDIWTDGRKPPEDLDPGYWGYSTAHWEGNVLVVDVTGFNGKTMLSTQGLPMSDAMHQIERWQRMDHDTLKIAVTFNDPKMYTQPWTATYFYKLKPDWTLDRQPCTMAGNKSWDQNMGQRDGLPGADYQGPRPNR